MKINGLDITIKDFEKLLKDIKQMKENLKNGEVEKVEWALTVLENHLENNLIK